MKRLVSLFLVLCLTAFASAQNRQAVLIKSSKPYDKLVASIEKMGGTVMYQYKYVDGIAAEVPESAMSSLEKMVGPENLAKDELVYMPQAKLDSRSDASARDGVEADAVAEATDAPADYPIDNSMTGANALHAAGFTGSTEVVAVIDSGYRSGITHVPAARVLTGFSLVPGQPDANSSANYPHGTQVAGQIAANRGLCFSNLNRFAVTAAALGAAQNGTGTGVGGNGCSTTTVRLDIIGSAPLARIYPVKIFPNNGAGSPTSRTIAAMEHVLSKRLAFNAGDPTGLNIRVVNMSLGGPTTFAGRSLSDQTVDKLLANDIVVVVSSGNEGFSVVTGGSPGTSMSALTVGASQSAVHERIFRSQFSAPCNTAPLAQVVNCATLFRPDSTLQMSDFSSRGPTHDGRIKPDVAANGSFNFGQGSGSNTTVNFISGTSFSSPIVAGIAAILRQAVPTATARQVRNAIIMSANPNLIPSARPNDQGKGFVDADAALALLQSGNVPDTVDLTHTVTRNLQANLAHAGVPVFEGSVTHTVTGIRPAETAEFAYMIPPNAASLNVNIRDITPANAPAQQNAFFGDDVFIKIQTSTVHDEDLLAEEFLTANKSYSFANPQAGIYRITPAGDWTNVGTIGFTVDIWTTEATTAEQTVKAKIGQGEQHSYTVTVPAGTASLTMDFSWKNMNGSYPINDLDAYLVAPGGTVTNTCATGRTPEKCAVANPAAGTWTVVVDGFSVIPDGTPGNREMYTVRLAADGKVLKTN